MLKICKKCSKLIQSPFFLLLAISVSLSVIPAVAYDLVVPGDLDGDLIVSDDELEAAQSSFDDGMITSEELEKIEHINENYPRPIIDTAGREVTFYKPVERIITRDPNTARIVVALGEGDKIVASDKAIKTCLCSEEWAPMCYSEVLDGRMPDIPETSGPYDSGIYYELMANSYPDVIITDSEKIDLIQNFETKVGCPCVVAGGFGRKYDYDGLYGQIKVIGDLLEKETDAEELIGFVESEIDMIRSITNTLDESDKPKIYFASRGAASGFLDPKMGWDFTRTITDYDPLDIAGGINVAAESEGTNINVAIEQIIAWNPDYIFLTCSSPDSKDAIDFVLTSPDLQSITAVQNGDVYNCFTPFCRSSPPDRNLINMIYMAKVLHPEEFQDVDLEKEGNEIFKAFLGVDGVFTEYVDYLVWPREYLNAE